MKAAGPEAKPARENSVSGLSKKEPAKTEPRFVIGSYRANKGREKYGGLHMLRKILCATALAAALCLSLPSAALAAGPGTVSGNWRQENGQWYYYDTNGSMLTGWILVNGKYYYL